MSNFRTQDEAILAMLRMKQALEQRGVVFESDGGVSLQKKRKHLPTSGYDRALIMAAYIIDAYRKRLSQSPRSHDGVLRRQEHRGGLADVRA